MSGVSQREKHVRWVCYNVQNRKRFSNSTKRSTSQHAHSAKSLQSIVMAPTMRFPTLKKKKEKREKKKRKKAKTLACFAGLSHSPFLTFRSLLFPFPRLLCAPPPTYNFQAIHIPFFLNLNLFSYLIRRKHLYFFFYICLHFHLRLFFVVFF